MFTGIIEETGVVTRIEPGKKSIALTIELGICARGLGTGDSLAVNGCCLTVRRLLPARRPKLAEFDLLRETWERTNFQYARPGRLVNLERGLRASGRVDGHFVTGHIDGMGKIRLWERRGPDWLLDVEAPREVARYLVSKGSVAVDGISLTVASVRGNRFQIWIIPHTYEVTALREREVGDAVNLEADILGKYVERFIRRR